MAMALALLQEGIVNTDIWLYDTFEGMTLPTEIDLAHDGTRALGFFDKDMPDAWISCIAGIEEVRNNMILTEYPGDRIHYVAGPVEETIPANLPSEQISLLRLDTDWYASTKHELENLFPMVSEGGVLIIDDYGHWQGSRKAVDEFFREYG